jgi:ribosomal protein S18 acetylase RimI-like enzyme
MKLELVEYPDQALIDFFDKRIEEFNLARWEVKEKKPLAVKVLGDSGEIAAGAAAKTFGLWMFIENLWIHESLRSQKIGTQILLMLETAAQDRGCRHVLLETLNFQARPFYEKHGYRVEWTQKNYPKDGCKYFMVKDLG